MATKYDRSLRKLEGSAKGALHKVIVDHDPDETQRERDKFMQLTKGRGSFVVIRPEAWDL